MNVNMIVFSDLFGTLDPFGSSSFSSSSNSSAGFADFSHMSKPRDPFEGRASWLPDYQKVSVAKTHAENTLFCHTDILHKNLSLQSWNSKMCSIQM